MWVAWVAKELLVQGAWAHGPGVRWNYFIHFLRAGLGRLTPGVQARDQLLAQVASSKSELQIMTQGPGGNLKLGSDVAVTTMVLEGKTGR